MRVSVFIALVIGAGITTMAGGRDQSATSPEPLARLRAYVAAYGAELPSLVAEELYVQNYTVATSGNNPVNSRGEKRTTRADLLMVRLPGNGGWIAFRDVFEVDQRPIRDREDRLLKLLQTPTADALTQARRLAAESARFNLGSISRTINVPDIALAYLQPGHQAKVTIDPPRPTTIDGAPAQLFRFRETAGPTIIISPTGHDVRAQGRVWADPASGAILRTELTVDIRSSTAVCIVDFRRDERLGVLVPSKMSERYTAPREFVSATATYSNFRKFTVSTAENVGKPPGF